MAVGQTMRFEPKSDVSTSLKQHLAPSSIQSLEVLELPVDSLDEYLNAMVEQNPFLALDYCDKSFEEAAASCEQLSDEVEDGYFGETQRLETRTPKSRDSGFDFARAVDERVEYETLSMHLRLQRDRFCYDESMKLISNAVIEALDDDGYFCGDVGKICSIQNCSRASVEKALRDIQTLSPHGVGAHNVKECLGIQIALSGHRCREVFLKALDQGLFEIAVGRGGLREKDCGLSKDEIDAFRDLVKTLDPRPGSQFSHAYKTDYLIPDLIIKSRHHDFVVEVSGQSRFSLHIDDEYASMLEDRNVDSASHAWLSNRYAEAQSILKNLDKRSVTLYRFGLFLVDAQYEFFRFGNSRLRPLSMKEAADALGVHESTISRTVRNKHVLTPWGIVPLKHFFSGALMCETGAKQGALSSWAVKERIRLMVAQEDEAKPLSDGQIMEALNAEGVTIKRRTVAKYRESIGIANQARRRR